MPRTSTQRTRPRPDGKRNQRRKDARPGEILEAALEEFGERGFAGTRLADIAERAGIVKGTIYRYFDTKEALFEAMVRSRLVAAFDTLAAGIDGHEGSTEELLHAVLTQLYAHFLRPDVRVLMRIVIGEGARFPALAEFYHREFVAKGRTLVRQLVARGVERGEFRPAVADVEPLALIAPVISAALWRLTFEPFEPLDLEALRRSHLEILLRGLRAG